MKINTANKTKSNNFRVGTMLAELDALVIGLDVGESITISGAVDIFGEGVEIQKIRMSLGVVAEKIKYKFATKKSPDGLVILRKW